MALRLFLVALVLALPPAARAEAPGAEPVKPAPALGPEVPRGAMARFLAACREGQYARAAEYLNLRQLPPSVRARKGPELARELETVLDRALWVDVDRLSDEPEGDPEDGLPPFRDSLGTIETATGPVEILIERVSQPGGPGVWKIAASTVAAIPALYDEFGWGPLANVLPAPFFQLRFLQIRLWQWIGLALLAAAAWLAAKLGGRLAVGLARRLLAARPALDGRLAEHVAGPSGLAVGLAVFATGARLLALAVPAQRVFVGAEKALAIVAVTWLALRGVDVLLARFERRLDEHRHLRAVATVPLGRRTLKIIVALLAFIAAMQNFGFNVTGLIAGVGLGSLSVVLAAQRTVENLFGSVSLVADQPVRVGDVCRFGNTVGTVEDIGLRSTRVRTLDRTLVTIPNAQFSTLALENLSQRDRIPVRATVTLPQGTSAERVRQVLAALREMIVSQPKVHADSAHVRFVGMDKDSLEIELFAGVLTTRWDEFVEIREQILLRALEVMGAGAALK